MSGHRRSLKVGRDLEVKPVEVYFYQGQIHGHLFLTLTVDGIPVRMLARAVESPFDELVEFLKDVLTGAFSSEFDWYSGRDQHGFHTKRFQALAETEPALFRFRLTDGNSEGEEEVFMDNIFERKQFALAFYDDLMEFMRTHFDPELWGEYWLYHGSIEPLARLVEEARNKGTV